MCVGWLIVSVPLWVRKVLAGVYPARPVAHSVIIGREHEDEPNKFVDSLLSSVQNDVSSSVHRYLPKPHMTVFGLISEGEHHCSGERWRAHVRGNRGRQPYRSRVPGRHDECFESWLFRVPRGERLRFQRPLPPAVPLQRFCLAAYVVCTLKQASFVWKGNHHVLR